MSHVLDSFDRIYIINLAYRTDRRREMDEQLRKIGLSLQSPNVELFEAVRPDSAASFPTLGARGLFMSHMGLLKKAADSGYQKILVLEDDLNFSDDFAARAPGLLSELAAKPWGLFYGGFEGDISAATAGASGCVRLPPAVAVQCTHFMGMQGPLIAAAARYLEVMSKRPSGDPQGGPMHVDGAYAWFRRDHPEFETFVALPVLGYQRASRTDIHQLKWFDRAPVVRSAVGWLRSLRN